MMKEYLVYIEEILEQIEATPETKVQIRQSLNEHVEIMIEKHGSMAMDYLTPAEQVAQEFNENLEPEQRLKPQTDVPPVWGKRTPYRRISKRKIFNLPLYHITDGYNPETGKFEVAKGFFAIGPVALGIFAYGGLSLGAISFGGLSTGLLLAIGGGAISLGCALGGLAIGGFLAVGGAAISAGLAIGGFAKGYIAIGGEPFGKYVYNTNTHKGNAIEWFRQYLPYFVKHFGS